ALAHQLRVEVQVCRQSHLDDAIHTIGSRGPNLRRGLGLIEGDGVPHRVSIDPVQVGRAAYRADHGLAAPGRAGRGDRAYAAEYAMDAHDAPGHRAVPEYRSMGCDARDAE